MLGGPGGRQPSRTLTDIETTLLRGLLDQILGVLRYAMEPIVALEPAVGAVEYNPQFLQAAGASDAMIVGEFEMVIGQERSPLTISLPLASLLPRLEAQRPRDVVADVTARDATTERVRERLADMPLEVSVRFDPVGLSPARVLSLAVGDVVPLAHRVGAPLTVSAGGVRYAQAVAGKSGTRLAALVVGGPGSTSKESS
jgi:flagellar motor switch protein FliM